MKRNIIVIAVLATIAFPAICPASPSHPGGYVSGFLGVSVPRDSDVTTTDFSPPPLTFNDRVEFDPGINVGGTAGYDFGIIRLEGELSYKQSDIKSVTEKVSGDRFTNVDGDLGALAMMANVFFDLHNDTPVTPYWGAGIGFAVLSLSDTFGVNVATGVPTQLYQSDDATVFAYQAGAGLEIALNRQFSLDLGYRYFGTAKAKFDANPLTTTELKFESHNGVVGFRVRF